LEEKGEEMWRKFDRTEGRRDSEEIWSRTKKNCRGNLTEQSEDEILKKFGVELWRKFDRTEGRRNCEEI
jgi:hypothetical protein